MRVLGALLLSFLLVAGGQPSVAATPDTPESCPAVAIVAARGSEQNDDLLPTKYSDQSDLVSNGFEAEQLRSFLQFAESRHSEKTGGSLLAGVPVLALDDTIYPAALPLPALAEQDEELEPLETVYRLAAILEDQPAHMIVETAARDFGASLQTAIDGAPGVLAAGELETGCSPDYLFLGYSQGAMVLTALEQKLAEQGRLAGVLYLGNPLLRPGSGSVVGTPARGGGLLSSVPPSLLPEPAYGVDRINYCVRGDFACDTTPESLSASLASGGGVHTEYFLGDVPSADDGLVADIFAGWISDYTNAS